MARRRGQVGGPHPEEPGDAFAEAGVSKGEGMHVGHPSRRAFGAPQDEDQFISP